MIEIISGIIGFLGSIILGVVYVVGVVVSLLILIVAVLIVFKIQAPTSASASTAKPEKNADLREAIRSGELDAEIARANQRNQQRRGAISDETT